jgi:hypothetical protein
MDLIRGHLVLGGFDQQVSNGGHLSNTGFNLGYGGRVDHGWKKVRGRGRDRGRGNHAERGGGRNNHCHGKIPAAGFGAVDEHTSVGQQALEPTRPCVEVVELRKTIDVVPQVQQEAQTTGEKRKEPQDQIMTEAEEEAAVSVGSKAKDKDKDKWCF